MEGRPMMILWLWIIGGIVLVALTTWWAWEATEPEDDTDYLLEALRRLT